MQLLIGSKNTSSWSMPARIVMREKGIPFEEVSAPMRSPDVAAQRLHARLPSGKVPPTGCSPLLYCASTRTLSSVDPVSRAYMEAVRATAGWSAWLAGAKAEAWDRPKQEGETLIEDLRVSA